MIKDIQNLQKTAKPFLETLFSEALSKKLGEIEIRAILKGQVPEQYFFNSIDEAIKCSYGRCNSGLNVYFGVNPRMNKAGKMENVHYLTTFHVDVDYGVDGHKKKSEYKTYDEAFEAIQAFHHQPTMIIHSGGGFHLYFVLTEPLMVENIGVEVLENINKSLSIELGGDTVTSDLPRILRIPGTFNYKEQENPREVKTILDNGPKYNFEELAILFNKPEEILENKKQNDYIIDCTPIFDNQSVNLKWDKSIDSLPVTDKIKSLILNGNNGSYISRSEADMAVITVLVNKGLNYKDIKEIFQKYPIGSKYQEKGPGAGDKYLQHSIEKAKEKSNLTESEMQNPLFISGSLKKEIEKEKIKYSINIVKFQEFIVKKYRMKKHEESYYRYNDKCYELVSEDDINHICQNELAEFRYLFTKSMLNSLMHYLIGDALLDKEEANNDLLNYLTLQNGLYNIEKRQLASHAPDIFTTNLLPYDFDLEAKCPRFLQFLNEIFIDNEGKIDTGKISFIQEAVGYGFHKSINIPALFFLVGDGSNGKSVFLNTITSLFGEHNTCSISLNYMSNEYYLLNLLGKMINISTETPKKNFGTDIVKAIVAGDWVTGRVPYQRPTKFKPFAKHFLAMNALPPIDDNSHGLWRRIYVVDFPRIFNEEEQDKQLTEKLNGELSGIFNWALEGYNRLRSKDFQFFQVKSMKKAKKAYRDDNDSVLAYIKHNFNKTDKEEDAVSFKYIYQKYRFFCHSEGYSNPLKKKDFKNKLKSLGYKVDNSTAKNNKVCIFGVKEING